MRKSNLFVGVLAAVALAATFVAHPLTVERQILGNLVWTAGSGAPSATQVPAPSAGSLYSRTDTGQVYMYDGANWITNHALGVGQGYKIARGTITLDGSNPSSANHGLTTVVACALNDVRSTAPGDEVNFLTYVINSAAIDVYAWTNTGGTDPTLAASTDNNDVIAWVCIGT